MLQASRQKKLFQLTNQRPASSFQYQISVSQLKDNKKHDGMERFFWYHTPLQIMEMHPDCLVEALKNSTVFPQGPLGEFPHERDEIGWLTTHLYLKHLIHFDASKLVQSDVHTHFSSIICCRCAFGKINLLVSY